MHALEGHAARGLGWAGPPSDDPEALCSFPLLCLERGITRNNQTPTETQERVLQNRTRDPGGGICYWVGVGGSGRFPSAQGAAELFHGDPASPAPAAGTESARGTALPARWLLAARYKGAEQGTMPASGAWKPFQAVGRWEM